MKTLLLISSILSLSLAQGCHDDNCARQVTGTFPGIGVPVESRLALCNSYLRTTLSPYPTTVTTTISRFTTSLPPTSTIHTTITVTRGANTTYIPPQNSTIVPTLVPPFATAQCDLPRDFSSACRCWTDVTPATTTLPTPTVTVTTTRFFNVACSPAATAVSGVDRFPCSAQWGMCSCLRSGEQDVCVRVGAFFGDRGGSAAGNITGPCAAHKECGVDDECDPGFICVYDGSCPCGKKRCYRAAPNGCDYQGLPIGEEDKRRRNL